MPPRKPKGPTPVEAIKHREKRANIPTEELREFVKDEEEAPRALLYPRDPSLDPQLVWKGKDEQDRADLAVPAVPIYIQEKIHPQALIENLRDTAKAGEPEPEQLLFADFNGLKGDLARKIDFYSHDLGSQPKWSNRMILGDSLLVMASLAEKEGLKGKVQMIYLDPPYGIKFGSNWQVSTRKREVKDGKVEDLAREPEVVKAKRVQLDIGACFPARTRAREDPFWTPAREALLGTASDAAIGRRLHLPHYRVAHRRRKLGVPAFRPRPRHPWARVDPFLGQAPDAAVAARFGMHEETVRRRRLKLRIPPSQPERRTIRRDAALAHLLRRSTVEIAEISDSEVAVLRQQLGVPPPPRRSRWTPQLVRRLGREPDETIARELGISVHSVRLKRCALGLRRRPWRPWSAAERAVLAETPDDGEATRRLGRTIKAIRHMRRRG